MLRKMMLTISVVIVCLTAIVPTIAQTGVTPQDLADPDGAFIDVNGVEIYYVEQGPTDGPAVMLLHGFGGSTFTWRDTMPALAEAGYRVIAFDRPPFGLSDKSPDVDYALDAQVGLTAGLMDSLAVESAVMVGHSAGGGVIAHFATMYPDRINALVFVAGAVRVGSQTAPPAPQATEGSSNPSPLGGLFEMAANLDPNSAFAQAAVRAFLTPERFAGLLSSTYFDPATMTEEIAAGYQRPLQITGWEIAFLAYFSSRTQITADLDLEAFAALDVPILILWGEEDTWVTPDVGQALHAFLPESQLITYAGVGHMPMEENIAQFNADLVAFLDAQSGQ